MSLLAQGSCISGPGQPLTHVGNLISARRRRRRVRHRHRRARNCGRTHSTPTCRHPEHPGLCSDPEAAAGFVSIAGFFPSLSGLPGAGPYEFI
jgi:hypothetical protein